MKSSILIIIAAIAAALGVITLVIVLSRSPDSGGPSGYTYSTSSPYDSVVDIGKPNDNSEDNANHSPGDKQSSEAAKNVVAMAYSLINSPYAENGDSPAGFDNSGFIYYVMRKNGFPTCPRGTIAQSKWGAKQTYENLAAGDLVFFSDEGSTEVSFGGIYAGKGEMIACITHSGETKVWCIDITTDYYVRNFVHGIAIS